MRLLLRLLPLGFLLVGLACASAPGDPLNTILAEIAPPGGAMKAVIFERGGGPGGVVLTQVSIVAIDEALPAGPGNVFISDAKPAQGRGISVKWTGATELKIAYPSGIGIYRNEEAHEGVTIEYEVLETAAPAATPAPEPDAGSTDARSTDAAATPADAGEAPVEPIDLPPPPGSPAPEPPSED